MIEQLNDIANIWLQWMGGMFWQVGLLILLVTVIDMAIRRWAWPQVRYVLWGLVFLKLVIPPTWQMPTSIVSWIQPLFEKQISIQIEPLETMTGISLEMEADALSLSKDNGSGFMGRISGKSLLFLGWVGGMVAFGFILIRKMSRLHRWHRKQESQRDPSLKIPEWFQKLLSDTATRLNLSKRPDVIFSDEVKSPAVYGLFRPVLLLPVGYLNGLSREEAEHILIHELCHLKRGDLWIHWFCLVLQMAYWFNPLLIWTRRRMRHVCEICCDLSVADVLREKTRFYRETLIRTARDLFTETVEPGLGLLGVFEEPFRLVPRLRWLEKKTWEHRKRKSAATIITSLVMIACVMPMAGLSQPASQNQGNVVQPANGVYGLADIDEPPRIIRAFPPAYPAVAEAEKIQGRIVVELVVTKEGTPKDVWVIDAEPPDIFEEAALEAVRYYLFAPAKRNGDAVDVRVKLPIQFALGEGDEFQLDPEAKEYVGMVHELSEVDQPPRVLEHFPPKYPEVAKRDKIEGKVVLRFVVDTDGKAREPEVVVAAPTNVFESAALEAIPLYKFEPAIMNGTPVNCVVKMPVYFGLDLNNQSASLPETISTFYFNNADIKDFIKFIGDMTGSSFEIDDDVKGKLTLKSTESMSVDELNVLFDSVLDKSGYAALLSGGVIRIKKK